MIKHHDFSDSRDFVAVTDCTWLDVCLIRESGARMPHPEDIPMNFAPSANCAVHSEVTEITVITEINEN